VHLRPCLDSAYVRGLCKGQLLAVPPPKLVAAAVPMSESPNCICADESLAAFFLSTEEVRNSVAASQRAGLCI